MRRGQREQVSTGAYAEAVSCSGTRRRWNLGRATNSPRQTIGGNWREATLSDMGSLFHCRCPLRTGHASARDCSKPHCENRIKPSVPENSEATRSAGKVELSDGLASAHEHRCGTYMVAPCNSR